MRIERNQITLVSIKRSVRIEETNGKPMKKCKNNLLNWIDVSVSHHCSFVSNQLFWQFCQPLEKDFIFTQTSKSFAKWGNCDVLNRGASVCELYLYLAVRQIWIQSLVGNCILKTRKILRKVNENEVEHTSECSIGNVLMTFSHSERKKSRKNHLNVCQRTNRQNWPTIKACNMKISSKIVYAANCQWRVSYYA